MAAEYGGDERVCALTPAMEPMLMIRPLPWRLKTAMAAYGAGDS